MYFCNSASKSAAVIFEEWGIVESNVLISCCASSTFLCVWYSFIRSSVDIAIIVHEAPLFYIAKKRCSDPYRVIAPTDCRTSNGSYFLPHLYVVLFHWYEIPDGRWLAAADARCKHHVTRFMLLTHYRMRGDKLRRMRVVRTTLCDNDLRYNCNGAECLECWCRWATLTNRHPALRHIHVNLNL